MSERCTAAAESAELNRAQRDELDDALVAAVGRVGEGRLEAVLERLSWRYRGDARKVERALSRLAESGVLVESVGDKQGSIGAKGRRCWRLAGGTDGR